MIIIDVNLLLYAYNPATLHHANAREWVRTAFSGEPEQVGLPWITIHSFLRISTEPRAFPKPFPISQALDIVEEWLDSGWVITMDPGERHRLIFKRVLKESHASGAMIIDAVLAAIAIEHGATLCTADHDFDRFVGLKLMYPLEAG